MILLFSLGLIPIVLFTIFLYLNWIKIKTVSIVSPLEEQIVVTVLVAVRNESLFIQTLLNNLLVQTYPAEFIEVIIIDDHSDDSTTFLVESFISANKLPWRVEHTEADYCGKKYAINKGVHLAKGKYILTTDGDCSVEPEWISTTVAYLQATSSKMVVGAVCFCQNNSLREGILALEFASLIGSGAALIGAGFPTMCNGANLAFDKASFLEVGGYEGTFGMASGDDEFLMHKLHKRFPGAVRFLKSTKTIVQTSPPDSWVAFLNQRRRWASKWEGYSLPYVKWIAIVVFLSNLLLLIYPLVLLIDASYFFLFIGLLVSKIFLEFLFLRSVLVYFGRKLRLSIFFISVLTYPAYVVYFGLLGRVGKYTWKGRSVT